MGSDPKARGRLRKCECGTSDVVKVHRHDFQEVMSYLRKGNMIMAFQILLKYEEDA